MQFLDTAHRLNPVVIIMDLQEWDQMLGQHFIEDIDFAYDTCVFENNYNVTPYMNTIM